MKQATVALALFLLAIPTFAAECPKAPPDPLCTPEEYAALERERAGAYGDRERASANAKLAMCRDQITDWKERYDSYQSCIAEEDYVAGTKACKASEAQGETRVYFQNEGVCKLTSCSRDYERSGDQCVLKERLQPKEPAPIPVYEAIQSLSKPEPKEVITTSAPKEEVVEEATSTTVSEPETAKKSWWRLLLDWLYGL